MPDETTVTTRVSTPKVKGVKNATPEVIHQTAPSLPSNPDYDAEGRLINETQSAANQAAREAILNLVV